MEKLIIFYLGVAAGMWAMYSFSSNDNYKSILKKHKDIVNWLRSELSEANKVKISKNIDPNKVKLLERIVNRLDGNK